MILSTISLFSYIDPGTGSLIFQVLAATIMGVVVAFQSVRLWFVNLISKLMWFKKNPLESSVDKQTEQEESGNDVSPDSCDCNK